MSKFWWQVLGLAISFAFVFAVIAVSAVARRMGMSDKGARKIVHIGVGHWILFALWLFPDWYFAIIGPVCFIILNYLSYKRNIFGESMELSGENTPGTVYYSIALTILVLFFWTVPPVNYRPIAILGILALAWGDGMASVVGERWGFGEFCIAGNRKTLTGSLAMWLFSAVVLSVVPPLFMGLDWGISIVGAVLFGFIAAVAEAVTPFGLDNLTIPIVVSFSYLLWM